MTNQFPSSSSQDQSENSIPNFLDIESRVFTQIGKDIYIGRDKIDEKMRSLLRDEAKNIQTTRLWEILNASAVNEAYNLALIQSTDFDQVQFAKALKHWVFFMVNILHILSAD